MQAITTPINHIIPLDFINGISYMATEYPSDEDLANLKHVTMTRNEPWMPHQYGPTHGEQWFDIQEDRKRKEQAQNAPHNNHEAMEYDLRNNNTR